MTDTNTILCGDALDVLRTMLGKKYVGIELNPEYIPIAEERLKAYEPPGTPCGTDDESG